MINKLLIVSGCYDGGLVGYECTIDDKYQLIQFNPLFKFLAHQGSIKTISFGHDLLATGGNDEIIYLYDIKKRISYGTIQLCKGTITSLVWQNESYKLKKLLSGTNNGKIYLFRAHDLEQICELNAHDGQINDIAIHPKGKVFISIGNDSKLKLWDLGTNLCVYNTKLNNSALSIVFSNDGNNYAFISDHTCTISSLDNKFNPLAINTNQTLTCIAFAGDELLLGTSNGSILSWVFLKENQPKSLIKCDFRFKSIRTINLDNNILVFGANSKGQVYCWRYIDSELIEMGHFNTETRLITMQISLI